MGWAGRWWPRETAKSLQVTDNESSVSDLWNAKMVGRKNVFVDGVSSLA